MNKKFLITAAAVAATLSPMVAQAQTRELQRDRQEVREEKRDLKEAKRYGDRSDVREERRDVREAKQELREDRQDWRSYKQSNRNAFRGNRFQAPFRYRTFNSGVSIGASYYSPRYRVTNYANYRLPQPGRYQTYVRHYNDVLLVNTRTGRVVQAYRGFYW
jgi:Ni/Co efflux regulator RcnB